MTLLRLRLKLAKILLPPGYKVQRVVKGWHKKKITKEE